MIGMKAVNEWHCVEHEGFPKAKAQRWWTSHGGQRPFPKTVMEWLERQHELLSTAEVQLDYARNPKYPDVMAHRVGPANDNLPEPANDNRRGYAEDWELDDSIPF
jgi:DNA repair protein RadD